MSTWLLCHRPADLTAQVDDGTTEAKIAAGLLADIQTRVLLHQQHLRGTARGGFQSQCTCAGKSVDAAPAGQVLAQPVEQGFADPGSRRLFEVIDEVPAVLERPRLLRIARI